MTTMKHLSKSLFATALLATVAMPASAFAADSFAVDPMHTQTIFTINHLGYSTITGNFHDIKGQLLLDDKAPANSSVTVTIGTASVDTGLAARDKDLQSAGFFNVEKFPTMTFKSTEVKTTGAKSADVMGNLTMLGVTKPVTLKVTFNRMAPDQMRNNAVVAGFTGTATIKRSDFGMKTYLPYIGDDVHLAINFEGIKQ
jgi:polyisoprenoid-binding protein YceI